MMSQPQTMSISQALSELKLLRKRLDGMLENVKFVTLKTKTRDVNVEEFEKVARATYQRFKDLHNRYNQIKAGIVVSNATATVKVGTKNYTVAEAVERKRGIEMEKNLLYHMKTQWTEVSTASEDHQRAQQDRLDKLLQQELGKDTKTSIDMITNLTDSFMRNNRAIIVDPLGLEKKIKEETSDIEEFEANIDWVLTESNGRVMITI
jgi:hypothetical protein